MENIPTEWSMLFSYRRRIHDRYREIWDVPLIKNRSHLLKKILRDGARLLDIGAGARGLKADIDAMHIKHTYKSMDIDKSNPHDFYDIDAIREEFDVVFMLEVIEHLSLGEGLNILKKIRGVTEKNGIVVISTPNIFNPSRYMRDSTHRTFYAYDELCGILNMAGFEIRELYRSYNDAFHRYILKAHLLNFVFRFLSIDYAYSLFAIGERVD
jgi:predicted SAM-dependent methyltransferase